jgi:hypothetical protein
MEWRLRPIDFGSEKPCRFLVAMTVDENSIARIPGFSAFLGESVQYEDRARLARYLNEA